MSPHPRAAAPGVGRLTVRMAVSLAILSTCAVPVAAQETPCWAVDTSRSSLIVHVRPAGLFSGQLHAHRFVPARWQGHVCFDSQTPESLQLELTVQAHSLEDRQPELSREDIQRVERQVAGPDVLDSGNHPQIRYAANRLTVERSEPGSGSLSGTLHGELSLHGQRRPLDVAVTARWDSERLRAAGAADLNQSDYGIEPYSRFLGTVSVEDRVTIEFSIDAARDER